MLYYLTDAVVKAELKANGIQGYMQEHLRTKLGLACSVAVMDLQHLLSNYQAQD